MMKRADSNDETPVWCRNCSGCVGAVWSGADEPLSTERKDTKKQKKMLKIMPRQKEQEKFQARTKAH